MIVLARETIPIILSPVQVIEYHRIGKLRSFSRTILEKDISTRLGYRCVGGFARILVNSIVPDALRASKTDLYIKKSQTIIRLATWNCNNLVNDLIILGRKELKSLSN